MLKSPVIFLFQFIIYYIEFKNNFTYNIHLKFNYIRHKTYILYHVYINLMFADQHCKLLYNQKRRKTPNAWTETKSMDELCQIKHSSLPLHIKFHPNEEQLVFVADRDSQIAVYETQNRTKLLQFSILKQQHHIVNRKSLITSFKIVNAQHEPILLVGTDDYVVRFFKPDMVGFKAQNSQLVTAFTAIGESSKKQSTKESGLIVEWDEQKEVEMTLINQ